MELRSIALATTALVAIATFVQPAAAGNSYMGKMNLGLGYAWEDWADGGESDDDISLNYTTLHGSASVNVPYNDRVNLQFDIFGEQSLDEAFDCGDTCGSFFGGFGAGLHMNYRDPEVGALGVFGAVARAADGGTSSTAYVVFAAGLEGEYYANAWTLRAQAGYLDSDTSGNLIQEAGFIRAGASYYASKRLKLTGDVGYLDGATSGSTNGTDVTEWNWGLSVEYLFGQTVPVSTYLEYNGQASEEHRTEGSEGDRHELRAGVRFYFGGGDDLQKADREGAGFESPDLIAWSRYDF